MKFGFLIYDLKDYGPEINRGYRFVLVIIDNFSNIGWTVPLKNKNALTKKHSSEIILISSRRKPGFIESDRGKELYNKIFQSFLITKILNSILETHTMELFLPNAFIKA